LIYYVITVFLFLFLFVFGEFALPWTFSFPLSFFFYVFHPLGQGKDLP
jgi:hypothetical protein